MTSRLPDGSKMGSSHTITLHLAGLIKQARQIQIIPKIKTASLILLWVLCDYGRISHDTLVKHIAPYGYHSSIKNLGLWTHKNQQINFTLVVDDFGVKYLGKEHALRLKVVLEDKYKVTID